MASAGIILSWATLLQSLLFAGLLAHPRLFDSRANRILLALMVVFAIEKADQIFLLSGQVLDYPRFAMIGNLFGALIAPLIYLHIRARIDRTARLSWRMTWVTLPFLALCLYATLSYHILSAEAQRALIVSGEILNPINTLVIPLTGDIASLLFLGAAIWALGLHNERVRNWFSTIEDQTLAGVRTSLVLMAVLIVVHFLWTLTGHRGVGTALNIGHFLLINALSLGALTARRNTGEAVSAMSTTANDGSSDEHRAVLKRAEHLLRDEGLYADPDLTIARLARRLQSPQRLVSEAINLVGGTNFHGFVNSLRIEAAKARIKAEPTRNLLDIAYEVGFNSKSTFNDVFRRHTGQTPSHFRSAEQIPKSGIAHSDAAQ